MRDWLRNTFDRKELPAWCRSIGGILGTAQGGIPGGIGGLVVGHIAGKVLTPFLDSGVRPRRMAREKLQADYKYSKIHAQFCIESATSELNGRIRVLEALNRIRSLDMVPGDERVSIRFRSYRQHATRSRSDEMVGLASKVRQALSHESRPVIFKRFVDFNRSCRDYKESNQAL